MRALDEEVHDAVWAAVQGRIPKPLRLTRRGRPRICDRVCFEAILIRLVTGSSWTTIEWIMKLAGRSVSDTTLRSRRDEWINAGVFTAIAGEALVAYDRIAGLDLSNVALDGSIHQAPGGGEGTGINPFGRGRLGFKWSMAVDAKGIPMAWVLDSANRHDYALLKPTLEILDNAGLARHTGCLHLDRGYGYKDVRTRAAAHNINHLDVVMRRKPGQGPVPLIGLGKRWIVEAANSWLASHGQLRRNTDRKPQARNAAFELAVALLITTRLIDWRQTWHRE